MRNIAHRIQVSPNIYAAELLQYRPSIETKDLPLETTAEFVMAARLMTEYNERTSSYRLEYLEGTTTVRGREIPNIRISRKRME